MIICSNCDQEIDEKESFCTECGNLLSETTDTKEIPTNDQNTEKNESDEPSLKKGKLVFPDDSEIEIDESQRLLGRADLKSFSDADSNDISRGHFTIFEENDKYYLEDGSTNVQYKASEKHTILNDEDITGKGKIELNDNDTINVSDVVLHFKMD
ncbi:MAG: FHA domain-containing protein [Thaumarchaeota archaeon]|nr:FHA domain-containing protein [Nitrososphaerota archaeon]